MVFNDTDATGQGVISSDGYTIALEGSNLTLDTGTPGHHPEDLVVIDMPSTNKVGHGFSNSAGRLIMTDNVLFNLNSGAGVEFNLGNGLLSGSGNLTKTGNSQLLVVGDNSSYSGNMRVGEGTLQVRVSNKAFGTGAITLTNGPSNSRVATVSFNNYSAAPTFTNASVWEQTPGVTNNFEPFYVINTDLNWAGDIASVNTAADDGVTLSVNARLAPYGRSSTMCTLSGDNSDLKFGPGKGFVTTVYLGVGSAHALGANNSAYVQIGTHSYSQAGILATAPVQIASSIDILHAANVGGVQGLRPGDRPLPFNQNGFRYFGDAVFVAE